MMAGDILGGLGALGGLMKGLTGLMPQDDPQVKLMNAQSQVSDLTDQETAVYTEIGRLAYQQNPGGFAEQGDKLRLIQSNLATAKAALDQQNQEKTAADDAAKAAEQARTCPSCGHENPDGVKFCQECGAQLGAAAAACPSCGAQNPPGTRFCGSCGQRLTD